MANFSIPIIVGRVKGSSDAQAQMRDLKEGAAQTFLTGTPVTLNGGYLIAGTQSANGTEQYAGIVEAFANNLATAGVGVPLSYGNVQNQSNAKLFPGGGPLALGTLPIDLACDTTDFVAMLGNAGASVALAQAQVGVIYGLTKDMNNYWYVDTSKSTVATGAVVQVVGLLDPIGTNPGRVLFRFNKANQQLTA